MSRPSWLTKEVIGWSMFDFANQAFTMVIITVMYQVYFINTIVPLAANGGNDPGKRLWETATIIAEIAIILISPLTGALADFSGAKKRFLFLTYIGCVIFTLALGLVGPGHVAWGMLLFILGYIFFGTGENFLNAFLPEIADHEHMGRVSAFSWTIAYTGALLSMAVAVAITQGFPLNTAILLNDGGRGFQPPSVLNVSTKQEPSGDALTDRATKSLAAANNAGVSDPLLQAVLQLTPSPEQVTVADFNGDGRLDLAVTDARNESVFVRLSNADRLVERVIQLHATPGPISAGDLDRDGRDELLIGIDSKSLLRSFKLNESGEFVGYLDLTSGLPAKALRLSDLDQDGFDDVAISGSGTSASGYRWVAVWCGVYFLLGGIPTFVLLKERKQAEQLPAGQTLATVGFHRMASTFRDVRKYRQLLRFLIIVMIYIAGMQVVIFYAGSITKDLFHFSEIKQGLFMLQVIVTGIIGAAITGRVQDRIGTRRTIQILLIIWAATMLIAAFAAQEWLFWVTGNAVGFAMGALGTSSRVMAGLLSPAHKAGEFFGFYGVAQKMAVILGMGFQFVLGKYDVSFNVAIGASCIFFILGYFLMFTVNEKEGREVAIAATQDHIRRHHDFAGPPPPPAAELTTPTAAAPPSSAPSPSPPQQPPPPPVSPGN